ncbi:MULTISPECIES: SPOR domain-containing protein [unclassified Spirosoma]|uniref:SPOR domain-containing protein n=1 Tax=unclassified Spirosoma TaxID=2621999 RepID=UPI000AF97113|nr:MULTISPECIES: SPOR domain-containing protein [unclassified Spirosoma]MBN8823143.1 SPOR domain-containing protein [Spirosoma sp.]
MYNKLGTLLVLSVLTISGCASSRSVSSGSSAVDYNSYNEDLASVRPIYNPNPVSSTPTTNRSTNPTTNPTNAPRRTDTRKPNTPIEALHINRKLDLVLDTIATQNRSIRYAPGYRIQVYVGNQRQEAEAAKLLISQNFPELSPYLTYNQPTYKLKVGDFMRRLDAERYYSSIHRFVSSAQLQPDKVDIRRSLLIK